MRFTTTCPHCGREHPALYHDSGIHDLICPHCGGAYTLFIRKHRFEMLFDLGARALLDGYAREAVSSFAAAFERLLEFYVRASVLEAASLRHGELGGDIESAGAELDATWKLLSSQSERQLGAFAHAYLTREGRAPGFLTPARVGTDFRNRVIHRGYLPQEAEVEVYAARLFSLMNRLLGELGAAALHMQLLQEREYAAHLAGLPEGSVAVFSEHPGMFRERRDQADAALNRQLTRIDAALPERGLSGRRGAEKKRPGSVDATLSDAGLNDAALFRGALLEGGRAFGALFGAGVRGEGQAEGGLPAPEEGGPGT